jgi:hypothetical protein
LPRSESFGICQQKQLKLTVLAAPREFLGFPTQIDSILFCRAAKILEFANESNSNWLYFVLARSENFWICQQRQLKLVVF